MFRWQLALQSIATSNDGLQDFFSHDPSADAINRTRNAVADVKNIMIENIEKVSISMHCNGAVP